jgi:hypothetical protein
LLNTNLLVLLHFLDAMGCDPDRYQDSILNAEGAYGRCSCPFMQNCPSLYCHGFLAAFGGTGIATPISGTTCTAFVVESSLACKIP